MGSGKSTVGKKLAKQMKYDFLDTDEMIEGLEDKSIDAIFNDEGEAYFRSLEENAVKWLKNNAQESVISTGGGMLVYCDELKDVGTIVYLKVPFTTIMSRMSPEELQKRPLFKDRTKAQEMYEKRDRIYEERADVIIDADTTIDEVLLRLSSAIA
jgi:shikimate kinase